MRKILFVCFIFLFSINIAKALPIGGYIGFRGGASKTILDKNKEYFKFENDQNIFVGGNVGLRLLDFRGELEYIYRNSVETMKFYSGKEKNIITESVMCNLYYNFLDIPFLRLYVNGGLGSTKYSTNYIDDSKKFTYSVGFGGTFTLMEIFSIDLGYRYFDMGKISINTTKTRLATNDIYLGLRFGF